MVVDAPDMPAPGFGTYSLTGETGTATVRTAIEAGYRHVDTARMYENEAAVGEAIATAAVPREALFVATKVGHFVEPEPTPAYVRRAVAESVDRLGVDRIDLLYVHWPRPAYDPAVVMPVLSELVTDGPVAHLGVSNFTPAQLAAAREHATVPIVANQVEMHPLLPQERLYTYLRERDVTLVAYSPLAQGRVFEVPTLSRIAAAHDATEAQVALAWLLQKPGVVPIPRTSGETHLRENLAARELSLAPEEVAAIEAIDRRVRLEDPAFMEWGWEAGAAADGTNS